MGWAPAAEWPALQPLLHHDLQSWAWGGAVKLIQPHRLLVPHPAALGPRPHAAGVEAPLPPRNVQQAPLPSQWQPPSHLSRRQGPRGGCCVPKGSGSGGGGGQLACRALEGRLVGLSCPGREAAAPGRPGEVEAGGAGVDPLAHRSQEPRPGPASAPALGDRRLGEGPF